MTFKMVELNSLQIKQTKELSFFNNANNISKVSSPAIISFMTTNGKIYENEKFNQI